MIAAAQAIAIPRPANRFIIAGLAARKTDCG